MWKRRRSTSSFWRRGITNWCVFELQYSETLDRFSFQSILEHLSCVLARHFLHEWGTFFDCFIVFPQMCLSLRVTLIGSSFQFPCFNQFFPAFDCVAHLPPILPLIPLIFTIVSYISIRVAPSKLKFLIFDSPLKNLKLCLRFTKYSRR